MPAPVEIDQEILVLPSFTLECGETLRDVPVAYKTWGKLNEQRNNVMIICHAFTGSSDVVDWCVSPNPSIFFILLFLLSSRTTSPFSCTDRFRNV
jgi:homoserine acetyltransferase